MAKSYKVMIIDDNPSLLELVAETLKDDYRLSAFQTGEEALEQIHDIKPHLVLLDIMMPGIDGFEVCRRIKADPELNGVRILFLSAKANLEDRLNGYKAGGDDYLIKPFEYEELIAKVAAFIRLIQEEDRRKEVEFDLRSSEDKYRSLIENSPDIIIHSSREGEILFSNRDFTKLLTDNAPKNIYEIVPEPFHEEVKTKIEGVLNTGQIDSFELPITDISDELYWFSTRVGPMIKSGEIVGVTLFSRDISEMKRIEVDLLRHQHQLEELVEERTNDLKNTNEHLRDEIEKNREANAKIRKNEEKYRNILENIEEGYYELDLNGKFVFMNDSLCKIFENQKEQLLNRDLKQLFEKADLDRLNETLNQVQSTGLPSSISNWERSRPTGISKYLETSISLIKEDGVGTGFRGMIRDVTERYAHDRNLQGLFKHAVGTLARAAEVFDQDTGDHTIRIGNYGQRLAALVGMDEDYQKDIQISAQLHDVGKIHITSAMLNKDERLTAEEFEVIKNHTLYGSIIIGRNPDFRMANEIAMFHHEKWNGSGYPDGLKGRAIPLSSRITAIVDVFDALISKRAYKKAFTYNDAKLIMKDGDDRLKPLESFDPRLLKVFLDNFDSFVAIHQKSLEAEKEFKEQRLNVLILEDDEWLVGLMKERFGETLPYADIYSFLTIREMKEFIDLNSDFIPQVCFIDVNLPDGIGHDAAAELKERFADSHLICITADDDIDIARVNLYGHRVFRKIPAYMDAFMNNLIKTTQIIREYHSNPFKI